MIKRIINLVTATSLGLLLFNVVALSTPIYADAVTPSGISYGLFADSKQDACNGLNQLGGETCGQGQSKISSVLSGIVTLISYVAGIIAIIMVIISGIRFTTSGGDSGKVASARTALVYALIGIAIAALAQVLVHFALNQASAGS